MRLCHGWPAPGRTCPRSERGRAPRGGRPAHGRLVSVEAVSELDAKAAQRPLHAVGNRALHGGVVALGVLLCHRVEADVRAWRRAGDGDPNRGAVGTGGLDLARLGIDRLKLAQGHVFDQLKAPSPIAEYAVGLVDDGVAFEVVVGASGAGPCGGTPGRGRGAAPGSWRRRARARPRAIAPAPRWTRGRSGRLERCPCGLRSRFRCCFRSC